MEGFQFLKATIRHQRAPVKSAKDAISQARGDLDAAERIAAEDRLNVMRADKEPDPEPEPCTSSGSGKKPKKQKTNPEDDPFILQMREKLAQTEARFANYEGRLETVAPARRVHSVTFCDFL